MLLASDAGAVEGRGTVDGSALASDATEGVGMHAASGADTASELMEPGTWTRMASALDVAFETILASFGRSQGIMGSVNGLGLATGGAGATGGVLLGAG